MADGVAVKALEHVSASPTERVMIRALVAAWPRPLDRDALTDRLFSGARNGGPISGVDQMRVYATRVRKLLRPYGWTIGIGGRGGVGNRGLYRLERIHGEA